MNRILCALSERRRSLLEQEPDLLADVVGARRKQRIAGLLDLGGAWDALDALLASSEARDDLVDAIVGHRGVPFGPELAHGRARLLEPAVVVRIAGALGTLPGDLVERSYGVLGTRPIHGGYGPKPRAPNPPEYEEELAPLNLSDPDEEAEKDELTLRLEQLVAFYRSAAAKEQSVLTILV